MKIFTAQQMRELDRLTVERCGIPYATLMETAGSRVVEAIEREFGSVDGKFFAVYCGKGNNGGDGFVIARHLKLRGAYGYVNVFAKQGELTGEVKTNFEMIAQMAKAHPYGEAIEGLFISEISEESEDTGFQAHSVDIVVDALFGTGLTRPVQALYEQAIKAINAPRSYEKISNSKSTRPKIVAVDIPSGLSSDSEHPIGPHVEADLTVSFTGPKIGNVLAPACAANGKLVIANIGTPEWLFNEVGATLNLLEESQIKIILDDSRRAATAHKNAVGDVLLIAGSRGKTGAAALAAESILRAGAGLVTVATAQSAMAVLVAQARNEVMSEALAETESGAIDYAALPRARQLADKRQVVAVGPGLNSSEETTRQFVRELVEGRKTPMVIDADGLNALAPWPEALQGTDELPIVITPHQGEMARLTGKTNEEITVDRIGIAREFATKHHVITVLKGSRSLIAAPDGHVYVNPTGNAGMATAGSGDVLTGLLAGLLAQRTQDALGATVAAVYLHGLAGDLAAQKLGQRSLIASDIIAHLSEVIVQVGGEAERCQPQHITKI